MWWTALPVASGAGRKGPSRGRRRGRAAPDRSTRRRRRGAGGVARPRTGRRTRPGAGPGSRATRVGPHRHHDASRASNPAMPTHPDRPAGARTSLMTPVGTTRRNRLTRPTRRTTPPRSDARHPPDQAARITRSPGCATAIRYRRTPTIATSRVRAVSLIAGQDDRAGRISRGSANTSVSLAVVTVCTVP